MSLTFTKMSGAGNDFVVMDNRDGSRSLTSAQIARLCDRHRGVGADGVMLVEAPENGATAKMRYYNADGGEVEMCGNGARCFAKFVNRLYDHRFTELSFETMAGVIDASFPGDEGAVCVQLSDPFDLKLGQELEMADGTKHLVHSVNTGVPHAMIFSPSIDDIDLIALGAGIRFHQAFAPAGTNLNVVEVTGPQSLRIRTYERGVEDETLACGTGMAAAALIHAELTGAASPIAVAVAGGDTLSIGFTKTGHGYAHVTLTGPADFVFEGTITLPEPITPKTHV